MKIGERIRMRRKALGMTQSDLARQVGITRAAVAQIESGLTHGPRPQHLLAYARALKMPVDELVHGDAPPPKLSASEPSPLAYARMTSGERDLLEYIRNAAHNEEWQRDRLARLAISLLLALAVQPVPDRRHDHPPKPKRREEDR